MRKKAKILTQIVLDFSGQDQGDVFHRGIWLTTLMT